jgi:hypothetical protein
MGGGVNLFKEIDAAGSIILILYSDWNVLIDFGVPF